MSDWLSLVMFNRAREHDSRLEVDSSDSNNYDPEEDELEYDNSKICRYCNKSNKKSDNKKVILFNTSDDSDNDSDDGKYTSDNDSTNNKLVTDNTKFGHNTKTGIINNSSGPWIQKITKNHNNAQHNTKSATSAIDKRQLVKTK